MQVNLSRKLLLAFPISFLFSSLCFAQTTIIEGDVKGEDGKALVGAVIKIDRTDIKQSYKVKTDKKGHYIQAGLAFGGEFVVTLEVNGKDADSVKGVMTSTAMPSEVNFDLKEKAERIAKASSPEEVERGMSPAEKAAFEKKKQDAEASLAKNAQVNGAFNAGIEAENNKKYDVAIQQFEKAAAIAPTQHIIWSHLADNYNSHSASKDVSPDEKKSDLDKAELDYQKAIELSPADATYRNNYALILVKQNKIDLAQVELGKAAALDPTSAGKYYYNLGAVLANVSQNDAASDAFKKSMDAGYAESYYQYGIVGVSKATAGADGKMIVPPGTIEALQKYLALSPTGANAPAAKEILATLGAPVQTSFDKSGKNAKK